MNETIMQTLYFIYFMLKTPFRQIYKRVNNLFTKPKALLNFSIFVAVMALFVEDVWVFLVSLHPNPRTTFFQTMVAITLIIYVWKYTDPRFGENWKSEYKIWRKSEKFIRKQDTFGQ